MSSASVKSVWYGMLETKKGSTIVLRDDDLPEALPGRLYLYNVDRDKIIEYMQEIVGPKLRELTAEEISELGEAAEKSYMVARKLFLAENKSSVGNLQSESAPAKEKPVIPEPASDGADDDDPVDDELIEDMDEIDEDIDWDEEAEKSA